MSDTPQNFDELFRFYNEVVKLLYSKVQVHNELPLETLFELNAALDHISRRYAYGESEEKVVAKAYSHLKRSCLDIFKIAYKDAADMYKELLRSNIGIIDNGEFARELRELYSQAREGALDARWKEGMLPEDEDETPIQVFARWEPVFEKCVRIEKDFYRSPKVSWAKTRRTWSQVAAVALSVVAGIVLQTTLGLWSKVYSVLVAASRAAK